MTNELNIDCPHCGKPFALTEALAAPLLHTERKKLDAEVARRLTGEREAAAKQATATTTAEYEKKLQASATELAGKDAKVRAAQEAELRTRKEREKLAEERQAMDLTIQRRVDEEKAAVAKQAAEQVAQEYGTKLRAAENSLAEKDTKLKTAEEAELRTRKEREKLAEERQAMDLTIQRRVDEERTAVAKQAAEQVAQEYGTKLRAAENSLAEKDAKLKTAEEAELQARKLKQEAEDAKRETELTVARRLDEERGKVREEAYRERDVEHRLKLGEKDKQLGDLRQQIEELRRKGDSSSQQLAGEVLELDLLETLRTAFPMDEFERVKKGQGGADALQTVRNRAGQTCGKILWESKRTKNWSPAWLGKLREDQRNVRADIAVLMSETLPEGTQHFDCIEGMWVTSIDAAVAMARSLRQGLIDVSVARRAATGADTKKDIAYSYLTGPQFLQRVRGAVEPVIEMRTELEREKRLMNKQWSTREKQLERAALNIAGMYGELQGIVGGSLPAVEGLSLPSLEDTPDAASLPVARDGAGSGAGASA